MADIVKLKQRFETLRTDRSDVEAEWDEIERFIMPGAGKTAELRGAAPDQKTDASLWDLTAPLACEHLASFMHGSKTNPAARWFDFEWDHDELEKDQEAVRHREAVAAAVWREIQASDFGMEIASGYHEWGGLGNMLLSIEPTSETLGTWEGFDFTAIPVREGYPLEDSRGGLLGFDRHLRWTPVQILDRFGEKGTPEKVKELLKEAAAATRKLDVIFAIWRRREVPLIAAADLGKPLDPKRRPFGFVYYLLDGCEQLGEEGGYYEMPVVLARWAKRSGQTWGFGRGHIALRHVKFLNGFKELARAGAACAVEPPLIAKDGAIQSKVERQPGGMTYGDPEDVRPLYGETQRRMDVAAEVLRDERVEIRRAFHEDDLQLKESPQMTAAEVQARQDRMDRSLGSPSGRLETDALAPLIQIGLRMMARAGRLPKTPPAVAQKAAELKSELRVKFRGSLARAQQMDEVVGIEREASFVAGLLKMGFEDARYYFDVGAAIREHSKRVGAPATTLRSKEEAEKLKKQDQELARAMAQAEIAQKAGAATRDLASAAAEVGAGGAPPGEPFPLGAQPALLPSGGAVP